MADEKPRERVLNDAELKAFWAALESLVGPAEIQLPTGPRPRVQIVTVADLIANVDTGIRCPIKRPSSAHRAADPRSRSRSSATLAMFPRSSKATRP
jgi:hypothetical protein